MKVLLISNKMPHEAGGRAEKIETRIRLLEQEGWEVKIGHVPESYIRSFVPSIYRCWRCAYQEDVDVIHSISNPMHLQVIGLIISHLTRLPWLAEFRDPIVKNPDREDGTFNMYLAKVIEYLTVHFADRVVWMDGIQIQKEYFSDNYPDLPKKKFQELPFLGFEAEKFNSASAVNYQAPTITYAGSFYEGWIEPYGLLRAFSIYIDRNEQKENDPALQFYGDWDEEYQKTTEEFELTNFVETHEFVPHKEIIPILKGSDIVVYVGGDDPENRLNVPSKIWDYIGAQTPILAIVDPSFRVAKLIEGNGLGIVVHPDDPEGIADGIDEILSGKYEYAPDKTVLNRFSRSYNVEALAEALDSVSKPN